MTEVRVRLVKTACKQFPDKGGGGGAFAADWEMKVETR
jgi:hypothetical protein